MLSRITDRLVRAWTDGSRLVRLRRLERRVEDLERRMLAATTVDRAGAQRGGEED